MTSTLRNWACMKPFINSMWISVPEGQHCAPGGSFWLKGEASGVKGLRFQFFGIIHWVGTSLAAWRQILTFIAKFWRFRAKKWSNSTFFGTNFEIFPFIYFFAFLTPPRAYMGRNTMLYAWIGAVWLKNAPNRQIWQKCQNHKMVNTKNTPFFIFDFLGLKSPAGMPDQY